MIQTRTMDTNSALQLIWRDGCLYVSDVRNHIGYRVNPDATNEEDAFLYGFLSFARYTFIDENFKPGFFISIK